MSDVDTVKNAFEVYAADGDPTKRNAIAVGECLAEDVLLINYDNNDAVFGKKQVADYLVDKLWDEVFPEPTGRPSQFKPGPANGQVLCLNEMRPTGEDKNAHSCLDLVQVANGLITEIRCCYLKQDLPPKA